MTVNVENRMMEFSKTALSFISKPFAVGVTVAIAFELIIRTIYIFVNLLHLNENADPFSLMTIVGMIFCPFQMIPGDWPLSQFWPYHVIGFVFNGGYYICVWTIYKTARWSVKKFRKQ